MPEDKRQFEWWLNETAKDKGLWVLVMRPYLWASWQSALEWRHADSQGL